MTQTGEAVFTAGNPGTGDGRSTLWSFSHLTPDIREIRFVYTGSAQNGVGVGFDLFYIGQLPPDVPVLAIDNLRRISLIGRVGRAYQVDYSASLPPLKWAPLTNVVLPSSPLWLIDATASNEPMRFYRAGGSP